MTVKTPNLSNKDIKCVSFTVVPAIDRVGVTILRISTLILGLDKSGATKGLSYSL